MALAILAVTHHASHKILPLNLPYRMNKIVKIVIHHHSSCFFSFFLTLIDLFSAYACVGMRARTPVQAGAFRGQRKAPDPLELELEQL